MPFSTLANFLERNFSLLGLVKGPSAKTAIYLEYGTDSFELLNLNNQASKECFCLSLFIIPHGFRKLIFPNTHKCNPYILEKNNNLKIETLFNYVVTQRVFKQVYIFYPSLSMCSDVEGKKYKKNIVLFFKQAKNAGINLFIIENKNLLNRSDYEFLACLIGK